MACTGERYLGHLANLLRNGRSQAQMLLKVATLTIIWSLPHALSSIRALTYQAVSCDYIAQAPMTVRLGTLCCVYGAPAVCYFNQMNHGLFAHDKQPRSY